MKVLIRARPIVGNNLERERIENWKKWKTSNLKAIYNANK